MKIGGLDIGTTGCKLTVFDENGTKLGKAYRDYPVRRAVSGHEIDISTMMESVYGVIGEMAAQYPDIAGIGVTSFGETFVMTDEAGNPLHNAMLYTDKRGAEECAELIEKLGADHIAEVTGLAPHEMYSISKMMWIKRHKPEVYAAARRIHLIEDYVVRHLTGRAQIDYSLATRTMAFDIHSLTWSQEVFDAAGIDVSLMSETVPTGTSAGPVTAAAAGRTGLKKDCIIVSVAHDQVAAAVGAGAFDGSVAVDGAGTVECLTPVYDGLPKIPVMAKGYFSVVPRPDPVGHGDLRQGKNESGDGGGLREGRADRAPRTAAFCGRGHALHGHGLQRRDPGAHHGHDRCGPLPCLHGGRCLRDAGK